MIYKGFTRRFNVRSSIMKSTYTAESIQETWWVAAVADLFSRQRFLCLVAVAPDNGPSSFDVASSH